MVTKYPGTTIEVSELKAGASRTLFEGIFATGGITLSQICVMTGLEYYMIQNWVRRGYLSNPKKRVYTREQFARVIIINMLTGENVIVGQAVRLKALTNLEGGGHGDDELLAGEWDTVIKGGIKLSGIQNEIQLAGFEVNFKVGGA